MSKVVCLSDYGQQTQKCTQNSRHSQNSQSFVCVFMHMANKFVEKVCALYVCVVCVCVCVCVCVKDGNEKTGNVHV